MRNHDCPHEIPLNHLCIDLAVGKIKNVHVVRDQ